MSISLISNIITKSNEKRYQCMTYVDIIKHNLDKFDANAI